ncbi:hypothetical protein EVAR_52642_1 [Eumeta japonica]|uniref:Uncharacterized protein n=1 Tax=Eumeta variegata TaxID=151549 RepID=A0A4C1XX00_EUMVA|nr:hypothetical protein EVAR_52642_1 [Eumeta japonica]
MSWNGGCRMSSTLSPYWLQRSLAAPSPHLAGAGGLRSGASGAGGPQPAARAGGKFQSFERFSNGSAGAALFVRAPSFVRVSLGRSARAGERERDSCAAVR